MKESVSNNAAVPYGIKGLTSIGRNHWFAVKAPLVATCCVAGRLIPSTQPLRFNAMWANMVGSRVAWLELSAPLGDKDFRKLTKRTELFSVGIDQITNDWRTVPTFPSSTSQIPIEFCQFPDVLVVNLKELTIETASLHGISFFKNGSVTRTSEYLLVS